MQVKWLHAKGRRQIGVKLSGLRFPVASLDLWAHTPIPTYVLVLEAIQCSYELR